MILLRKDMDSIHKFGALSGINRTVGAINVATLITNNQFALVNPVRIKLKKIKFQ
jgi:hypothetical protein